MSEMRHCTRRYGVNWGEIEGKHPYALILHNPLKSRHQTAKRGNRGNLTETQKIPRLEAAGINLRTRFPKQNFMQYRPIRTFSDRLGWIVALDRHLDFYCKVRKVYVLQGRAAHYSFGNLNCSGLSSTTPRSHQSG